MKNNQKVRQVVSWILLSLCTLVMVACSGDKDTQVKGTSDTDPIGGSPVCAQCGGLLASALGESPLISMDSVQLGLDFYQNLEDENGVQALGNLYVERFNGFGICEIPAGLYVVETSHGGTRNGVGLIGGLTLRASGPVQIELRVHYFSLLATQPVLHDCAGVPYPYELLGQVNVLEVNDKDCAGKVLTLSGSSGSFCHIVE